MLDKSIQSASNGHITIGRATAQNLVSGNHHSSAGGADVSALQAEIRNLQQKVAIYQKTAQSQRRQMEAAGSAEHLLALENLVNERTIQIEQLQIEIKLLKKVLAPYFSLPVCLSV